MDRDDSVIFWMKTVAAVLLCGLLIYGLYGVITYRSETTARATQFSWMRKINIERWMTVQDSGWDIPPTGRELRSYRAIHHWESVWVGSHRKCTTTGTGKNKKETCRTIDEYSSVPVYRTKYDYEIERWAVIKTPELSGNDKEPIWPDVTDIHDAHDPPQIGDERPGMRTSRYTIVFQHETKAYTLDFPETRWMTFKPNASYTIVLNIFGQPLDVKET